MLKYSFSFGSATSSCIFSAVNWCEANLILPGDVVPQGGYGSRAVVLVLGQSGERYFILILLGWVAVHDWVGY